MSDLLNKEIVIKLNKSWTAVDKLTVGEAVVFLCKQHGTEPNGYVMDYETFVDEKGEHHLTYSVPMEWDEWITLPVRDGDLFINTSRGKIRVPKVVITAQYNDVPDITIKGINKRNVYIRDGGIDQYSGEPISLEDASVDHVLARSKGGKNVWENVATTRKTTNTRKGNRSNEEAGLKLIKQPKAPASKKRIIRKHEARLPDQRAFLLP